MNCQKLENNQRQIDDDEIDLVQLFQILLKRKYLIFGVTFFCLIGGGGYTLLKKSIYEYTTTLQIGTALIESKNTIERSGIESSPSVKLKLEQVYIPAAIIQLIGRYDGRLASALAKEQKNSNIILITSKGGAEDEHLFKELHTIIVSPLIANHREAIAVLKKQYEILVDRANLTLKDLEDPKLFGIQEGSLKVEIEAAQMELAGFDERKLLLLANKTGLTEIKNLLTEQISRIEENLKLSYVKRNVAISEVDDAAKAMTFLTLNSEIQQNENRLSTLRERLYVDLDSKKKLLESQLAENQRARRLQVTKVEEAKSQLTQLQAQRLSEQEQQRNTIAAAENKINLYRDTRALNLAVRSLKSVGTGKSLILVFAGMLGLMGGVMLAFFAEFMTKVRQQQTG